MLTSQTFLVCFYQLWKDRLPLWLRGRESTCNARAAGDMGSIPGPGWTPGGGHGNPLQYSCPENPMDRGTWWAIVHGVAKGQIQLKQLSTRTHTHTHTHTHTQSVTSNAQTHLLNTIYKKVDNTLAPCENAFIPWPDWSLWFHGYLTGWLTNWLF